MTDYTLIQNHVMTSNISDSAYRVLSFLTSMCYGEKTECFPSQIYISEHIHKSVRSIQRNINELVDAGYLSKRRRGSISNMYTVLTKVVAQKTESFINNMKKKYNDSKKVAKVDRFNDYPQRPFDPTMEAKLLGWDAPQTNKQGEIFEQMHLRE